MAVDICCRSSRKSLPSVLVVDDSLFMRTLVADQLRSSPEIGDVKTASSGTEAIRKINERRPDCVTLDLMMPGLDGLTTLKFIKTICPTPVIILSAYGREGTDIDDRCRAAGAASFIAKPLGGACREIETIGLRLITEVQRVARLLSDGSTHLTSRKRSNRNKKKLITLGASTGGQITIEQIIERISSDFSSPILVIQHAPDRFSTESFARRLNNNSAMPVKTIDDGEFLHDGVVYLAPGGSHLTVETSFTDFNHTGIRTIARFRVCHSSDNDLSPSIDMAMKSAADAFGSNMTGIILSGIGNDGVEGMRAIKAAGGRTIVQDQSAITFGMPQAVIAAGLADEVFSAEQIARAIDKEVHA